MVPNPFVHFAQDPVGTAAAAAFAVAMLAALLLGGSYAFREGIIVLKRLQRPNRQQEDWMGTWPDGAGWLPPGTWTIHAAKVAGAVIVTLFAVSALAWAMGA